MVNHRTQWIISLASLLIGVAMVIFSLQAPTPIGAFTGGAGAGLAMMGLFAGFFPRQPRAMLLALLALGGGMILLGATERRLPTMGFGTMLLLRSAVDLARR